jgi:hypothetical protein
MAVDKRVLCCIVLRCAVLCCSVAGRKPYESEYTAAYSRKGLNGVV